MARNQIWDTKGNLIEDIETANRALTIDNPLNVKCDGIVDDSIAIQEAINFAYANGRPLRLPPGRHKITKTLLLPPSLRIEGINQDNIVYGQYSQQKCVFETYCQNVFQPLDTANPKVCLNLSGVYFKNKYSSLYDAVVFKGINLYGSYVYGNVFDNYGTILEGNLAFVTQFFRNFVMGVGKYFVYGDIVDSFVRHNYINGKPTQNAVCFSPYSVAMSEVEHNFIDFFKTVFDFRAGSETLRINGNTFDFCYRVCGGLSLSSLNILGNTFRNISKERALSLYPNADSDMVNGDWIAIEGANGINRTSIVSNQVRHVDTFLKVRKYNVYQLKTHSNIYEYCPTKIDYLTTLSQNVEDQKDISIEEMMYQDTDLLISPLLTGGGIVSFNKQIIVYNGKPLINVNGEWHDMLGNVVTS